MTGHDTVDIDLWCFDLDEPFEGTPDNVLSQDEVTAAMAIRDHTRRRRQLVCRARLRLVLSRYASVPPRNLAFRLGKNDKPSFSDAEIGFNIAHCGATALVAVAPEGEVGVDIEALDRPVDVDGLAQITLTAAERIVLATLPPAARRRAFLRFWTRKEAVLKATGAGIADHLQSCDVRGYAVNAPDADGVVTHTEVRDLDFPGATHVGAVAAVGGLGGIRWMTREPWEGRT